MSEPSANTTTPVPTGMTLPVQVVPGAVLFGRYRLDRELGRGGFGVVWHAHDIELGLEVALKFLPDLVARDPEAIEDLKREIRRGLRLTHPGVVRVHNFIRNDGLAAIAMEFVDGITLRQQKLNAPDRCLDVDDLRPLIGQLCEVLSYVHEVAKLVHRDLKPGNIMVSNLGEVKIADFGIAGSLADSITRMTNAPAGGGTLAYMSPQQARGETPAVTDDVYALGATLYELLTGKPPFFRGDIALQASEIIPPPMNERRVELGALGKQPIPPNWESAIAACLAKVPESRPQSVRELGDLLAPASASAPIRRQQPPTIATLPPPLPPVAPPTPPVRFEAPPETRQTVSTTSRQSLHSLPPPPAPSFPLWPFAIGALVFVLVCAWLGWQLAEPPTPPSPSGQTAPIHKSAQPQPGASGEDR